MATTTCLNDDSFGPVVQGCRDDFDFTLRFQHIVLAILPATIFLGLSIPRTIWLSQQPKLVSGVSFQFFKLTLITILVTLQFALLSLQTAADISDFDGFAVASTSLNLGSALAMLALSFFEHSMVPRPSTLLILYLILQILFDVVQVRTSWLMADSLTSRMIARLFTASVVAKFVVLIAETQRKSRWLHWEVDEHSPEETSGVLSLSVYFWLHGLFRQGYSNVLAIRDLYPLDRDMDSDLLQQKLTAVTEKTSPGRRLGLTRSLARALCIPYIMPIAPRVALIGFSFSQPLFIRALLEYLQEPDAPKSTSYGLIGASVLIYAGAAFARALHWYFHVRALQMTRGALCATIYKKTTEAKLADAGDAAAVTLMSTDTDRAIQGLHQIHEFWASPIEIAIGCWFLERELGASFVAPIILIVICAAGTTLVGRLSGARQVRWMSQIQKRVGLTANVISNMKSLRISGITLPVGEFIQGLRVQEMEIGNRSRWLMIWSVIAAMTPIILSPVAALAFTNRELNPTTMFTSISFLILVTSPLSQLFQAVPMLFAGIASLGRIQTFVEADTREDARQHEGEAAPMTEKPFSDEPSSSIAYNEKGVPDLDNTDPARAITIRDGYFGWTEDKMILNHVNVRFPVSQLTLVVGPTAAGKSTLCNVLLGEVPFSRGRVRMPFASPAIGYCEQAPFLWNGTIKENILGFSDFNQPRYEEVVEACMLVSDFMTLPQGDATNIGSNGIALSGGQKQRVSLARALYLQSDLVISDDILSGLDNDTANEVFRRVFGPGGLLPRRKTTAILCTHSISHLPLSDHIIALDVGGLVVEEGSFDDLMRNKKYVASLNIAASSDDETEDETDSTTPDAPTRVALPRPQALPVVLSDVDEHSRQTGDTKVYGHYFRALSKWSLIVMVASSVLHGFCNNMATAWLKFWSEDTLDRSREFYLGIYGFLKGGHLLTTFLVCVTVIVWITTQSGTTLHHQALDTVVHAPLSFFTTTDLGIVTNIFSQDMTLIDGELPLALLNTVIDIFEIMGMAAVVGTASPYLSISYPVFAVVLWAIQKFYLRTSRQLRLLDLEAKSPLYTHYLDTIKGISTFRAFGWTSENVSFNQQLLNTSQRPSYLLAMIQRWLSLTMEMLVVVIAIIIVSLATQMGGNTGFTGASLVTLMSLSDSITYLIRNYTALETSIGAVSRIKTFSEKVPSENREDEDLVPGAEWPSAGKIELRDVSASYSSVEEIIDDDASSPVDLVLKNVTLSIKPGQKVALCGRSGSGKSSLILVLLRLLEPLASCSQSIEFDDIPLSRINRDTLRRRIIAVPQDAVFLPKGSSIKDNLDPFHAATDIQCREVIDTVLLGGFLANMGGDIHAGMGVDDLSAGQKQLFSLGRAILRRRMKDQSLGEVRRGGILLLDEVSSNVDRETDRMMQGIIREEFREYTIVMVSHRLDMVMDFFDEVVVIDKGEVVETGDPRALVVQEGSRFGQLWAFENRGRATS
ncbi:canalicular multispecific organic anion transporter 1 [Plectosphaerella plurivora]|uniref:Canalicular multispecific organic anion transporter 1 n=1 Tax=Plectosphaerella plurivora TaxID=936078 RepID=A0A9P8V8G9_9PEZI|nr:canalicular multispecific organic anion transporter 1 [Plectosphaerella plurivora]